MTPFPTIRANQHVFKHVVNDVTPDYENLRPYFGWVNVDTVQKTMEQSTQWRVSIPTHFPLGDTSSLETQHLMSIGDKNQLPLTLLFLTPLQ